jgi:hypothetical protein
LSAKDQDAQRVPYATLEIMPNHDAFAISLFTR